MIDEDILSIDIRGEDEDAHCIAYITTLRYSKDSNPRSVTLSGSTTAMKVIPNFELVGWLEYIRDNQRKYFTS